MSQLLRLSIWDGDVSMENWYSAATGRKPIPYDNTAQDAFKIIQLHEETHVKYPSGVANDWFYSAADYCASSKSTGDTIIRNFEDSWSEYSNSDSVVPFIDSKEASFSKRFASRHQPPYFDYLFANAGLDRTKADNFYCRGPESDAQPDFYNERLCQELYEPSLTHSVEDASSPHSQRLCTPPPFSAGHPPQQQLYGSASTQLTFHEASRPVTINDLAANDLIANGDGFVGQLVFDEADQADKIKASAGFYGGFAVEESPSPYHAPLIDEISGFGDSREGCEEFPEQWGLRHEERPKSYTIAEADAMMRDVTYDADEPRFRLLLKPTSRQVVIEKRIRSNNVNWRPLFQSDKAVPTAPEVSKSPVYLKTELKVKKRNARDSFVTKSTCSDDDVQYLHTKRVRTTPSHQQAVPGSSPRAPSFSPISNYGFVELKNAPGYSPRAPSFSPISEISFEEPKPTTNSPEVANRTFSGTKVLPPSLIGFPGQFRGIGIEERLFCNNDTSQNTTSAHPSRLAMGDRLHPNYLFTHTNFYTCPDVDKIDYTEATGPQHSNAIAFAYAMTEVSAQLQRTPSQEHLRREIQLECTSARLEGVSVGQYRYYQGHLNIEEYKDASICICWDVCACSKMCTRFGDLACLCSKHIEMQQH